MKKLNKKEIIIIASIAVLVIIIAIVCTIATNKKDNNASKNTEISTEETSFLEKESEETEAKQTDKTTKEAEKSTTSSNKSETKNNSNSNNKQSKNDDKKETTNSVTKGTLPAKGPLTDAQIEWVVNNYFKKFTEHGASPNLEIVRQDSFENFNKFLVVDQYNYKYQVTNKLKKDDNGHCAVDYEADGCKSIVYSVTQKNNVTYIEYFCSKY